MYWSRLFGTLTDQIIIRTIQYISIQITYYDLIHTVMILYLNLSKYRRHPSNIYHLDNLYFTAV